MQSMADFLNRLNEVTESKEDSEKDTLGSRTLAKLGLTECLDSQQLFKQYLAAIKTDTLPEESQMLV